MDDNRFDDIIKKKAEGYKDTGHDANALTDFRKRMSSSPSKTSSFWNGSKMAYMAGSMLLFTLINFGIVWYFSEGRHAALNNEIEQLKSERSQVIRLQDELNELKTHTTDTVFIYRDLLSNTSQSAQVYQPALQNSANSEFAQITKDEAQINEAQTSPGLDQVFALLSDDQQLSEELETFLKNNNLLLKGDGGELILIVHSQNIDPIYDSYYSDGHSPLRGLRMPDNLPKVSTLDVPEASEMIEKRRMSPKMAWALEKHNHRGIDLQFGAEGKYHVSSYEYGSAGKNSGVGLMTELIFSPVMRLETGIHFGARSYRIGDSELDQLPPGFLDGFPGYDDQLGELISLESEADLIKVPLNLKVFGVLDHNKKWYASVGLTPQWARQQEFDYKYTLDTPNPPVEGEFVSFVGSKQEAGGAFYTTTLNLGVGTEVYINEKLRWQLGVFYQKGLSDAGVENANLTNSFGVKTSIWYNRP